MPRLPALLLIAGLMAGCSSSQPGAPDAAAATGNLPRILVQVKQAQLQLIKDSQASKWGKPFLLPVSR